MRCRDLKKVNKMHNELISRLNIPELAAEKTNTRIHAFRMAGRTLMPLIWMATTKGEAAAEVVVDEEVALRRSGSLYGRIMPRRKTSTT